MTEISGKREPEALLAGKLISVREMGYLLGIRKTDSYWLLHKDYFETMKIAGRTRIVTASFLKWYENQDSYHLITGEEPGKKLRRSSYSIRDIAELLMISESQVYDIIHRCGLPTILVNNRMRVPREAFGDWYRSQEHYLTKEDREKCASCLAESISMPEAARCLGISRKDIYRIMAGREYGKYFEITVVAGRKRITREGFIRFLASQDVYTLKNEPEPPCRNGALTIREGRAYIFINKELQRVSKEAMEKVAQNDILFVFPSESQACTTLRVLKTPKTEKSTRKVFLPETVARMLEERKKEQESMKDLLGDEYHDYNLVITSVFGMPMGESSIREAFYKLIKEHDLPQVVFHSLRHTSITYKLKLNGGDIKSVQGDSGHAQVSMVTEVYSHILDEERRKNAQLFEEAFYRRKELDPKIHNLPEGNVLTVPEGVNVELLAKVLANPEMTALLTALAKSMG